VRTTSGAESEAAELTGREGSVTQEAYGDGRIRRR
jgi:hypothetical protein